MKDPTIYMELGAFAVVAILLLLLWAAVITRWRIAKARKLREMATAAKHYDSDLTATYPIGGKGYQQQSSRRPYDSLGVPPAASEPGLSYRGFERQRELGRYFRDDDPTPLPTYVQEDSESLAFPVVATDAIVADLPQVFTSFGGGDTGGGGASDSWAAAPGDSSSGVGASCGDGGSTSSDGGSCGGDGSTSGDGGSCGGDSGGGGDGS